MTLMSNPINSRHPSPKAGSAGLIGDMVPKVGAVNKLIASIGLESKFTGLQNMMINQLLVPLRKNFFDYLTFTTCYVDAIHHECRNNVVCTVLVSPFRRILSG